MWDEFNEWEKDEKERNKIKEIYDKTYKNLEEIIEIEEILQETLEKKIFDEVISFIEKIKNKENFPLARKLNMIERFLTEFPYEIDIWRTYLDYVNKEIKTPMQLHKYYKRACKCCPKEIDFCRKFLRNLTKTNVECEEFEGEIF